MAKQLPQGIFTVEGNNLFFHPLIPSEQIPHLLKINGIWKIDSSSNLIFVVAHSYNQLFGKTISFSTQITKAKSNVLCFELLERTTPLFRKIGRIILKGRWQVFEEKYFCFEVKREHQKTDKLFFKGTWELDANNQIIYFYEKKTTTRLETSLHSFILQGFWQIQESHISYWLEKDKHALCFKTGLTNLLGVDDRKIYFTLGLEGESGKSKRIGLFGNWKIKNDREIEFIIRDLHRKTSIVFSISKVFPGKHTVTLSLDLAKSSKPAFELRLVRNSVNKELFLSLFKNSRDVGIKAGVEFKF